MSKNLMISNVSNDKLLNGEFNHSGIKINDNLSKSSEQTYDCVFATVAVDENNNIITNGLSDDELLSLPLDVFVRKNSVTKKVEPLVMPHYGTDYVDRLIDTVFPFNEIERVSLAGARSYNTLYDDFNLGTSFKRSNDEFSYLNQLYNKDFKFFLKAESSEELKKLEEDRYQINIKSIILNIGSSTHTINPFVKISSSNLIVIKSNANEFANSNVSPVLIEVSGDVLPLRNEFSSSTPITSDIKLFTVNTTISTASNGNKNTVEFIVKLPEWIKSNDCFVTSRYSNDFSDIESEFNFVDNLDYESLVKYHGLNDGIYDERIDNKLFVKIPLFYYRTTFYSYQKLDENDTPVVLYERKYEIISEDVFKNLSEEESTGFYPPKAFFDHKRPGEYLKKHLYVSASPEGSWNITNLLGSPFAFIPSDLLPFQFTNATSGTEESKNSNLFLMNTEVWFGVLCYLFRIYTGYMNPTKIIDSIRVENIQKVYGDNCFFTYYSDGGISENQQYSTYKNGTSSLTNFDTSSGYIDLAIQTNYLSETENNTYILRSISISYNDGTDNLQFEKELNKSNILFSDFSTLSNVIVYDESTEKWSIKNLGVTVQSIELDSLGQQTLAIVDDPNDETKQIIRISGIVGTVSYVALKIKSIVKTGITVKNNELEFARNDFYVSTEKKRFIPDDRYSPGVRHTWGLSELGSLNIHKYFLTCTRKNEYRSTPYSESYKEDGKLKVLCSYIKDICTENMKGIQSNIPLVVTISQINLYRDMGSSSDAGVIELNNVKLSITRSNDNFYYELENSPIDLGNGKTLSIENDNILVYYEPDTLYQQVGYSLSAPDSLLIDTYTLAIKNSDVYDIEDNPRKYYITNFVYKSYRTPKTSFLSKLSTFLPSEGECFDFSFDDFDNTTGQISLLEVTSENHIYQIKIIINTNDGGISSSRYNIGTIIEETINSEPYPIQFDLLTLNNISENLLPGFLNGRTFAYEIENEELTNHNVSNEFNKSYNCSNTEFNVKLTTENNNVVTTDKIFRLCDEDELQYSATSTSKFFKVGLISYMRTQNINNLYTYISSNLNGLKCIVKEDNFIYELIYGDDSPSEPPSPDIQYDSKYGYYYISSNDPHYWWVRVSSVNEKEELMISKIHLEFNYFGVHLTTLEKEFYNNDLNSVFRFNRIRYNRNEWLDKINDEVTLDIGLGFQLKIKLEDTPLPRKIIFEGNVFNTFTLDTVNSYITISSYNVKKDKTVISASFIPDTLRCNEFGTSIVRYSTTKTKKLFNNNIIRLKDFYSDEKIINNQKIFTINSIHSILNELNTNVKNKSIRCFTHETNLNFGSLKEARFGKVNIPVKNGKQGNKFNLLWFSNFTNNVMYDHNLYYLFKDKYYRNDGLHRVNYFSAINTFTNQTKEFDLIDYYIEPEPVYYNKPTGVYLEDLNAGGCDSYPPDFDPTLEISSQDLENEINVGITSARLMVINRDVGNWCWTGSRYNAKTGYISDNTRNVWKSSNYIRKFVCDSINLMSTASINNHQVFVYSNKYSNYEYPTLLNDNYDTTADGFQINTIKNRNSNANQESGVVVLNGYVDNPEDGVINFDILNNVGFDTWFKIYSISIRINGTSESRTTYNYVIDDEVRSNNVLTGCLYYNNNNFKAVLSKEDFWFYFDIDQDKCELKSVNDKIQLWTDAYYPQSLSGSITIKKFTNPNYYGLNNRCKNICSVSSQQRYVYNNTSKSWEPYEYTSFNLYSINVFSNSNYVYNDSDPSLNNYPDTQGVFSAPGVNNWSHCYDFDQNIMVCMLSDE